MNGKHIFATSLFHTKSLISEVKKHGNFDMNHQNKHKTKEKRKIEHINHSPVSELDFHNVTKSQVFCFNLEMYMLSKVANAIADVWFAICGNWRHIMTHNFKTLAGRVRCAKSEGYLKPNSSDYCIGVLIKNDRMKHWSLY